MRSSRVSSDHLLRRATHLHLHHHHRHRLLHPPLLAPANQLNGVRFTDVIQEANYHKSVIYHTHEERQPCPGTAITQSAWTLAIAHCLLCVCRWTRLYVPGWLTLIHGHTVGQTVGHSGRSNKGPVFTSVGERRGRWKCFQTRMGGFPIQAALKQSKTSLQDEANTPLQ